MQRTTLAFAHHLWNAERLSFSVCHHQVSFNCIIFHPAGKKPSKSGRLIPFSRCFLKNPPTQSATKNTMHSSRHIGKSLLFPPSFGKLFKSKKSLLRHPTHIASFTISGVSKKMVGFPNKPIQQTHGLFLLKMMILGCEMGVPPLKETPIYLPFRQVRYLRNISLRLRTFPLTKVPLDERSIKKHLEDFNFGKPTLGRSICPYFGK